jgi:hypothetical protein
MIPTTTSNIAPPAPIPHDGIPRYSYTDAELAQWADDPEFRDVFGAVVRESEPFTWYSIAGLCEPDCGQEHEHAKPVPSKVTRGWEAWLDGDDAWRCIPDPPDDFVRSVASKVAFIIEQGRNPRWLYRTHAPYSDGCECDARPGLTRACRRCVYVYGIEPGTVFEVQCDLAWPFAEWLEQWAEAHDRELHPRLYEKTPQERNARWESEAPVEYARLKRTADRIVKNHQRLAIKYGGTA